MNERWLPPDGRRVAINIHPDARLALRRLLTSPAYEGSGVGYSEFIMGAVRDREVEVVAVDALPDRIVAALESMDPFAPDTPNLNAWPQPAVRREFAEWLAARLAPTGGRCPCGRPASGFHPNGTPECSEPDCEAADRAEVKRLREALDTIYAEANDGTDDAHRRLCTIMETVAKSREQS